MLHEIIILINQSSLTLVISDGSRLRSEIRGERNLVYPLCVTLRHVTSRDSHATDLDLDSELDLDKEKDKDLDKTI